MQRVVPLLRISMDKEDIGNQKHLIDEDLRSKGWTLACEPFEVIEHGEIGQYWTAEGHLVEARAQLVDILTMARSKKFEILWLYHHDRLTRQGGTTLVNYIRQFAAMGIRIYDHQAGRFLDPDTDGTQEILYGVEGMAARNYIEQVKLKTRAKMDRIKAEIAAKGFYVSKAGNKITRLGGRPKGAKNKQKRTV